MKGRWRLVVISAVLCGSAAVSYGARIRPNGDPTTDRVIWADPFDNYTQWAYNNSQIWQGGPTPAGSASGTYPEKGTCPDQQVTPGLNQMAQANWPKTMNCGIIYRNTDGGQAADPGIFEANKDPLCGQSGEIAPLQSMFATLNYCWFEGGSRSSMTMFDHNVSGRIQQIATARGLGTRNSVNGTDANPLVLVFYLIDVRGDNSYRNWVNNVYVELNLSGDHAPTDYIWRGDSDPAHWDMNKFPEYCPQGPYPVICQQVREVNGGVSEDATDLDYLNSHCPPLVPAYNPTTGQGKTWSSIAFGLLAIMDKDPCGVAEQGVDSHKPNMDHYVVFDGNKWREIRNSRYLGLNGLPSTGGVDLPWTPTSGPPGYDSSMAVGTGTCNNFSNGGGGMTVVYMKIITDYILLYVDNNFYMAGKTNPPWHAAVPRIYKGPFDTVSMGVGPGCELDSATYTCKAGGTPKQCLTYSTNFEAYWRSQVDAMSLYGGDLQNNTQRGACCKPDGTCSIVTAADCALAPAGVYHGDNSTCAQYKCCPTPFADINHDGDVDGDDFGAFQACYTGASGTTSSACVCFDRDDDGHVSSNDLTAFKNCWTGPNVPWSALLTPACAP